MVCFSDRYDEKIKTICNRYASQNIFPIYLILEDLSFTIVLMHEGL